MNAELNTVLHELRRRMEELYGDRLERVILFGSRARGDADPDSDIDVLVVLKGEVKPGEEIGRMSWLLSELSLEYDTVVTCVPMSSQRWHETDPGPLIENVRSEGIAL